MFTAKVVRKQHVNLGKVQAGLRGPSKVKVGLIAGEASDINIMKGIYNEFGTKGSGKPFGTPRGGGFGGPIPERPFMRSAMRDNKSKYRNQMKSAAKQLLTGHTALYTVLSNLGIIAQGDIQDSITSWTTPGNSPVTIAIKGSDKPLTDTGAMQQAIQYEIGKF